jgi:hypothetical protein
MPEGLISLHWQTDKHKGVTARCKVEIYSTHREPRPCLPIPYLEVGSNSVAKFFD